MVKYLVIFLIFMGTSTGCLAEIPPTEFSAYFQQRQQCLAFTDALVAPIAKQLSEFNSIQLMREWIVRNKNNAFSMLVLHVQSETKNLGNVDLFDEAAQLRIFLIMQTEMQKITGYTQSGCGSDVREYVAQSLYLNIGGVQSAVAKQFLHDGIEGVTTQSHYLLASLLVYKY